MYDRPCFGKKKKIGEGGEDEDNDDDDDDDDDEFRRFCAWQVEVVLDDDEEEEEEEIDVDMLIRELGIEGEIDAFLQSESQSALEETELSDAHTPASSSLEGEEALCCSISNYHPPRLLFECRERERHALNGQMRAWTNRWPQLRLRLRLRRGTLAPYGRGSPRRDRGAAQRRKELAVQSHLWAARQHCGRHSWSHPRPHVSSIVETSCVIWPGCTEQQRCHRVLLLVDWVNLCLRQICQGRVDGSLFHGGGHWGSRSGPFQVVYRRHG